MAEANEVEPQQVTTKEPQQVNKLQKNHNE